MKNFLRINEAAELINREPKYIRKMIQNETLSLYEYDYFKKAFGKYDIFDRLIIKALYLDRKEIMKLI